MVSDEKMPTSAELRGCVIRFIYFLGVLYVRYYSTKSHHFMIYATDHRDKIVNRSNNS